MRVRYICKWCTGEIASAVSTGAADARLGLDQLTARERNRVLSMDGGGLIIHTYCDGCIDPSPSAAHLPKIH